ncbi:MAG: hemophore-related protein [Mycobacterium sp.]|uniref:hemophore-related protein n=1 Tax=Mycobacterium sp. TaxID=1785 RepID=UPI003BB219CE
MVTRSLIRLAVAGGGLALSLVAGAGIASADPGMDAAINTTCSYPQVVGALNAQSPAAAAKFNSSPMAQGWLRSFLASPPPQRAQMAQQAAGYPGAAQYIGLIGQIATSCNNF